MTNKTTPWKNWHEMSIDEKFKDTIEKYKCNCENSDHHGCHDCQNTGYLFDTQEIALIEELYDHYESTKTSKFESIFYTMMVIAAVLFVAYCGYERGFYDAEKQRKPCDDTPYFVAPVTGTYLFKDKTITIKAGEKYVEKK